MKLSFTSWQIYLLMLCIVGLSGFALAAPAAPTAMAPAGKFDLNGWKLQIPGPQDIPELANYSSKYFYLDDKGQMCFWIDASETGHTANSTYVRSELRHLPNWDLSGSHELSATLHASSQLSPDKVTVLQIHGITESGENAPPLLRVALNGGTLYSFVKTDNSGNNTESTVLALNIGEKEFSCTIRAERKHLIILVDGVQKLDKDLSFWKYPNYFKAGCYPQSHQGTATVFFRSIAVK